MEIKLQAVVKGHDAYESDDFVSPKVKVAYELGEAAVVLPIKAFIAERLREETGNGFTKQERDGQPFKEYKVNAVLKLKTDHPIRKYKDRQGNQKETTNPTLGFEVVDLLVA